MIHAGSTSPKKLTEQTVLDDKLIVEKAFFENPDGKAFSRLRVQRQEASAVLLLDVELNTVILTRQFRYPVSAHTDEDILEIAAGKIDDGETPEQAAIREVEEETGYKITADDLRFLLTCYASPGYSTEIFHIYVALISNATKVSNGGGLADEHEQIELVELSLSDFRQRIRNGSIKDAKTCLAGLYLDVRV